MTYPKPLSQKSLDKMVKEANFSEDILSFLKDFFLACCNLYGQISIENMWEVYKELKQKSDVPTIHRKDLVTYSSIARREEHPYYVFEVDEIFTDKRNDLYRHIVDKRLITFGQQKFETFYRLCDAAQNKPFFVPEDLLSYVKVKNNSYDRALLQFLGNLKITAKEVMVGENKVRVENRGKKLRNVHFYTYYEKLMMSYYKGELEDGPKKGNSKILARLQEDCRGPESEKLFRHFKLNNSAASFSVNDCIRLLVDEINEAGVQLDQRRFSDLVQLLMNCHNHSHLWCNRGWVPVELAQTMSKHQGMPSISFGPGLQKLFEDGTLNKEQYIKAIQEQGFKVEK